MYLARLIAPLLKDFCEMKNLFLPCLVIISEFEEGLDDENEEDVSVLDVEEGSDVADDEDDVDEVTDEEFPLVCFEILAVAR